MSNTIGRMDLHIEKIISEASLRWYNDGGSPDINERSCDLLYEAIKDNEHDALYWIYTHSARLTDPDLAQAIVVAVGNYYPTTENLLDFLRRCTIGHPCWEARDAAIDQLHGNAFSYSKEVPYFQLAHDLSFPSERDFIKKYYLNDVLEKASMGK